MSKSAPWSFSRIKAFKQCPKQFYHEKVIKQYPFKETDATIYGTAFHEAAEEYIRDGKPLPERFLYSKDVLDALAKKEGEKLVEYEMGLTADLKPCGFNDEGVWFRGIADLIILNKETATCWVIDYKTGRNARYADKGQLELMALAAFKHFPYVDTVRGGLLFVVANELLKANYYRKDEAIMWQKWLAEHGQMELAFENDRWNPIPSGLCKRHCPVVECIHNGVNT